MDSHEELVREFVRRFAGAHEGERIDAGELAEGLDGLAMVRWACETGEYDGDFDVEPSLNREGLRERVCRICPWLGYYAIAIERDPDPSATEVTTGDAVDDLVDILQELMRVLIRCESLGAVDAGAYFAWSYDVHWGMHLRCLQLFVYHHSLRW